jgi:hypothetical protein
VGAAVAFEPIFKAIIILNITLEDVIKGFRILTAVMIGLGSAAVLGAIVKVTKAMMALGEVVSKNKLITIIGALASVGAATATWLGLTKETEQATEAVADNTEKTQKATEKTQRDQSAITELYAKQKQTLADITTSFDRQLRQTQDRLDLELESLGLSEQQKKIRQEQARIEEQTQSALNNLKQKFDALDENSRKKRQGDYERERAAIIANGDAAKQNAERTLELINRQTQAFQDQQRAFGAYTDARVRLFERVAQVELEANTTFQNRVSQEEKLNTIVAIRQRLLEAAAAADLKPEDLERVKLGIIDATTRVDLLGKSFEELETAIGANVITSREMSDEQAKMASKILESSRESLRSITMTGEAMARENERIRDYQRSFTTGWATAYQRFADDATNAARQAERVFDQLTRGLEDAFVNFAKTGRLSFRDMINGIVEDLLRSQIRQLLAQIFNVGGSRGGGGILGSIGKIFGFASGGVVPGNRPILVGEQGPEIFMPPGQGTVIPNNQLGGGMTINYNISAVDARSFQELVARDPEFIYAVTERGRRGLPQGRR